MNIFHIKTSQTIIKLINIYNKLYSIEYDLCYNNLLPYLYSLRCLLFVYIIICKGVNVKILIFKFFKLKK